MTSRLVPRIIALEGPSLAGKTSLARRVIAAGVFEIIPEYTDAVPSSPHPEQRTIDGQLAAFRFFMTIEAERCNTASRSLRPIVLDRSVDTLLAHAFALETMNGLACYAAVRGELASYSYLVPDLTLFLDASVQDIVQRRGNASPRPRLLLDPHYVKCFRQYFAEEPMVSRDCRFMTSDAAAELLLGPLVPKP